MYINKAQVLFLKKKHSKRVNVFVGLMIFFFVVTGFAFFDDDLRKHFNVYAVTTIIFSVFYLSARLQYLNLVWYERTAMIFENSAFDQISLSDFSSSSKKTPQKVKQLLDRGLQLGVLQNIYIDGKHESKIVLAYKNESSTAWVEVKCPSCGAPNMKKRGFVAACEYCHSKLT